MAKRLLKMIVTVIIDDSLPDDDSGIANYKENVEDAARETAADYGSLNMIFPEMVAGGLPNPNGGGDYPTVEWVEEPLVE